MYDVVIGFSFLAEDEHSRFLAASAHTERLVPILPAPGLTCEQFLSEIEGNVFSTIAGRSATSSGTI